MYEMVIYGVSFDMVGKQPIVLLKTVDGNRFLPIWIGHPEAAAILMKLQGASTPRPMTHDLLSDLLEISRYDAGSVELATEPTNLVHLAGDAIESMHDAGPLFSADPAEVVDMVQQGIHQCACRVAGGRVYDHSCGLVDDDQIGILVENGDRQGLGPWFRLGRFRNFDGDALAALDRAV